MLVEVIGIVPSANVTTPSGKETLELAGLGRLFSILLRFPPSCPCVHSKVVVEYGYGQVAQDTQGNRS